MANIKSQIKRNRQNEARHERNKAARTRLKTEAKKVQEMAAAGGEEAVSQLRSTSRMIDKAAAKGVLSKRTAARRKSRLARAMNRGA